MTSFFLDFTHKALFSKTQGVPSRFQTCVTQRAFNRCFQLLAPAFVSCYTPTALFFFCFFRCGGLLTPTETVIIYNLRFSRWFVTCFIPASVLVESSDICALSSLHSIGISNITRSKDEEGRRIVQYDIKERVTLFGIYESTAKFRVTVTVIQENAVIQNTAKLMGGMLQTKQTWRMSDSEKGTKDETLLEDPAEYTAPRILAMLVKRKAYAAHIERNNDIRRYVIETISKDDN